MVALPRECMSMMVSIKPASRLSGLLHLVNSLLYQFFAAPARAVSNISAKNIFPSLRNVTSSNNFLNNLLILYVTYTLRKSLV